MTFKALVDKLNRAPIQRPPSVDSDASTSATDSSTKRPATDGAPTPPAKRRRKPDAKDVKRVTTAPPTVDGDEEIDVVDHDATLTAQFATDQSWCKAPTELSVEPGKASTGASSDYDSSPAVRTHSRGSSGGDYGHEPAVTPETRALYDKISTNGSAQKVRIVTKFMKSRRFLGAHRHIPHKGQQMPNTRLRWQWTRDRTLS